MEGDVGGCSGGKVAAFVEWSMAKPEMVSARNPFPLSVQQTGQTLSIPHHAMETDRFIAKIIRRGVIGVSNNIPAAYTGYFNNMR
ncbi:hypothetical protein D3C71_2140430 [compost metagenome]